MTRLHHCKQAMARLVFLQHKVSHSTHQFMCPCDDSSWLLQHPNAAQDETLRTLLADCMVEIENLATFSSRIGDCGTLLVATITSVSEGW